MVAGTTLILVILVFLLIFLSLVKSLSYKLRGGQLRISVLRLKDFGPWISHKGFLRRRFGILGKLFIINDAFIHLSKY